MKLLSRRGVTVIELGVVVVLIGLTALLLSPLVKAIRTLMREARCVHNLERISLAIREYALENDGRSAGELALIYQEGYVGEEGVFDCPFSQHIGTSKEPDYIYSNTVDFNSSENPVIVYDKDKHKDGLINVLYLNGEIEKKSGVVAE